MLFTENKAGHGLTCTLVFMKADCKTFGGQDRLISRPYTLEKDSSGGMTFKNEILTIQLQMTLWESLHSNGRNVVAQDEYKGVIKTFEYHASKAEASSSWGIHNKKASLDTVRAVRAGKSYILLLRTGWMTLGDFPNLSELQFPNRKMEMIVLTLWVCCEDYIEWCILKKCF